MYPTTARYSEIQKQTASRERLMVLLFEAALRHTRQGAVDLENRKFSEASVHLTKAADIVVELHASLDRSKAPELCDELGELYRFISLRLVIASTSRNPQAAYEAERALAPVAEAFSKAVDSLAQENK